MEKEKGVRTLIRIGWVGIENDVKALIAKYRKLAMKSEVKVLKSVKWVDAGGNQCTIRDATTREEKGNLYVETIGKGTWIGVHMSREAENKLRKLLNERHKERKLKKKLKKKSTEDIKHTSTEKTEQMLKTDLMLEFIRDLSGCYINDFVIRHRLKAIQRGPNLAQYYREVAKRVLEIVEEEPKTEKPSEDSKTTEQKSLLKGFNFLCQSKVKTDLMTKTNLMVDLLEAISGQVVGTFARDNIIVHRLGDDTQNAEVLLSYYSRVIKEVLKRVES